MGQRIEIASASVVDESLVLSTNRSFTGTDGEGYDSGDEARASGTFGGKLAGELFAVDDAMLRVYVASNIVVLKREGGWPSATIEPVSHVVEKFFLFYQAA